MMLPTSVPPIVPPSGPAIVPPSGDTIVPPSGPASSMVPMPSAMVPLQPQESDVDSNSSVDITPSYALQVALEGADIPKASMQEEAQQQLSLFRSIEDSLADQPSATTNEQAPSSSVAPYLSSSDLYAGPC